MTNEQCSGHYRFFWQNARLSFITALLLLLSTVGGLSKALAGGEDARPSRPNILFILADDHRWDLLGNIHPIIKTPNLDRLAEQGTYFSNAFVTTPICASSRISILTGLTERTHDFTFGRPPTGAIESQNVYLKLLKDSGYRSGFVGKYEIKLSGDDSERFDYFYPLLHSKTNEYQGKELPQTYYITQLTQDFIESSAGDQPWAIAVNFWNPHALDSDKENQYHYPAEFENWYADVTIPPAKLSDDASFEQLPEFLQQSIGRVRWEYRYANEAMYQKMVKRYYRAISAVDQGVGMILKTLEQSGMADNTIVIYTSDNGYNVNERQLAGKWFGWEEDLRIPLIVYDPRKPASHGKQRSDYVLNIDFPATMLDLAGIPAPETYQGESFLPMLDGQTPPSWRHEFFFEHMYQPKRVSIPPMAGVRTQDWKYVNFYKHGHQQLYSLKADPDERENLAQLPEYQGILNTLSQRTAHYIERYENQRSEEVKARKDFVNQLPAHGAP
ncbi:DUF4976 domain-containing protein [Alteromonas aestuariivivens]|uniref:DUF4976 domain-containing protein n=1 Tax=Alteromonas aestuariivivens TaxID=1938339 RepID=A0A3D8M798_9ALTE|nr:sulfatase [Alteromonas aestuariivivens]RDV25434.1 DUF4976 domain-containing protein [Alteromonas aestuariivivens]